MDSKFKKVALRAAKAAGKILEKNFRKKISVSYKKDLTPLTGVDLMAEKAIIGLIKRNFPSHDILSEEAGGKFGKEFTWIVDPLDGTTNYIAGISFFAVSIALIKNKEPVLGVIFNPITRELYSAQKGKGAYLNGKKIKINQTANLSKVILNFNKGTDLVGVFKTLIKLAPHIRTFRCYGSIDGMCYLAAGKIEAYITSKPKIHDIVAGALIIKEAGGKITDFDGKEWRINSRNVLAANKKIHRKLLKLIR